MDRWMSNLGPQGLPSSVTWSQDLQWKPWAQMGPLTAGPERCSAVEQVAREF